MDIWKTEMIEEGVFTEPVNLGDIINTPCDEAAPFIHPDGSSLYFASDGHPGMGGMDIFYAMLLPDDSWSEPINMGYPINTFKDEINIFINAAGNTAYYASNKEGGYGGMDIYYFTLDEHLRPNPVTYMKGKIKDKETGEPLGANLELIDLDYNKLITATSSDPITGDYMLSIRTGSNVLLNISHPFYLFFSENFKLKRSATELQPFLRDIYLKKPEVGSSLVLKNIFFDFNQSDLKPESFVELDILFDFLQKNKSVTIEIGGHTDDLGSEEYNNKLSLERAKSVSQYLIDKKIDTNRITYKGYGKSQPIESNDTEEGRAANRRTEIKIIGN